MHCCERGSNFWIEDRAKPPAFTIFGARCYVGTDTLYEQNIRKPVDHYFRARCRFCHFRCEQLQSRVECQALGLICLDQDQLWKQTLQRLNARRRKAEPSRNYCGRRAASSVMDHVAAVSRCSLTK